MIFYAYADLRLSVHKRPDMKTNVRGRRSKEQVAFELESNRKIISRAARSLTFSTIVE